LAPSKIGDAFHAIPLRHFCGFGGVHRFRSAKLISSPGRYLRSLTAATMSLLSLNRQFARLGLTAESSGTPIPLSLREQSQID